MEHAFVFFFSLSLCPWMHGPYSLRQSNNSMAKKKRDIEWERRIEIEQRKDWFRLLSNGVWKPALNLPSDIQCVERNRDYCKQWSTKDNFNTRWKKWKHQSGTKPKLLRETKPVQIGVGLCIGELIEWGCSWHMMSAKTMIVQKKKKKKKIPTNRAKKTTL